MLSMYLCIIIVLEALQDTQRNGYRRWFPRSLGSNAYNHHTMCPAKLLRRQSSGGCRFNPDFRRATIQEYLTLVPGYS